MRSETAVRDAHKQLRAKESTDERSRRSEPVWWAWLDLNQRPHPERKIARVPTGSAARGPTLAGPPDSHPSWRPPAMRVLSEIDG